jgi:hypothetical protein
LPRFNVKEYIEGTKRAKKADLKKCCNDAKHKVTPESENIDKPLKKRLRVIKADDVSPTPPPIAPSYCLTNIAGPDDQETLHQATL